jgi:FRG domain
MKKSTTMDCAMTGKAGSNVEDFMIEDLSYEKDVQRSVPFEEVVIKTPLEIIEKFTVSVRSDPTIVWRGQRASSWGLTPSLFRLKQKSKEWHSIECFLLRNFEKSNTRWVREHYETFAKLWSFGVRYESAFPDVLPPIKRTRKFG